MGLRLGVDLMDTYITRFGLKEKTGIDLPGEAGMIMHKKENMGLPAFSSFLLNHDWNFPLNISFP